MNIWVIFSSVIDIIENHIIQKLKQRESEVESLALLSNIFTSNKGGS